MRKETRPRPTIEGLEALLAGDRELEANEMRKKTEHRLPTIEELEALLREPGGNYLIEIMPNGEIRSKRRRGRPSKPKPLTFKENIGGEYARSTHPYYPVLKAIAEQCALVVRMDTP